MKVRKKTWGKRWQNDKKTTGSGSGLAVCCSDPPPPSPCLATFEVGVGGKGWWKVLRRPSPCILTQLKLFPQLAENYRLQLAPITLTCSTTSKKACNLLSRSLDLTPVLEWLGQHPSSHIGYYFLIFFLLIGFWTPGPLTHLDTHRSLRSSTTCSGLTCLLLAALIFKKRRCALPRRPWRPFGNR